jgi:hypothetical protein
VLSYLRHAAFAAAASTAFAGGAQQPPPVLQRPPDPPQSHWYGSEIMLADAASLVLILTGTAAVSGPDDVPGHVMRYVGLAGLVAVSPLIHAFGHRQYGRAVLSVVLRDAPLIGAVAVANSCHGGYDACISEAWGAALLGLVGAVGVIIDWTALSWEPVEPARVAVVPLVGKRNGAALAVKF